MTRGTYGRMHRVYYGRNGMSGKNPTSFFKKTKKGVDGSHGVCYIMTVAPMRAAGERKQARALERRRMYPENYTMQNS